jgi:hypothetical protein
MHESDLDTHKYYYYTQSAIFRRRVRSSYAQVRLLRAESDFNMHESSVISMHMSYVSETHECCFHTQSAISKRKVRFLHAKCDFHMRVQLTRSATHATHKSYRTTAQIDTEVLTELIVHFKYEN